MSEVSLDRLLILFSAGLGFMVLGGLNFFLAGRSRRLRMGIGGSAAAICSLAPLAFASVHISAISFAVILLGLGFLGAVSSTRATSIFQSASTILRRASVHSAILAGSGVALAAGSLTFFTAEEEQSFDRDMDLIAEATARPPLHLSTEYAAETDIGTEITLKTPELPRIQSIIDQTEKKVLLGARYAERVIRVSKASDMCNCHGWVFTGGRFWLSPDDVELILKENGYQRVSDPQPGDVVIYRQGDMISHTGVVHSTTIGNPPLVEGKWGWMGVFLHRVEDTPYGKVHEFYRSSRSGHVVRGLDEHPNQ